MADSTFWKGLALWLGGFAAFALFVGGVFAVAFLGVGQAPPPMDDLHVSNDDDANHTVRIEVAPVNGSKATFERTLRVASGERRSLDGTTDYGREYRLLVTVDDREPEAFEVVGPDDLCTTEVQVEPNATVEVGTLCA